MARTVLSPVSAYLQPASKRRLDRIVKATSHRMTLSKLLDELAELGLPALERKYLISASSPAHDDRRRLQPV